MFNYGKASTKRLHQGSRILQRVLRGHANYFNSSIIETLRGKVKQNKYFKSGMSKVSWPDSKHNIDPAEAVDLYPWHSKYGSLTTDPECIARVAKKAGVSIKKATTFIVQQYYMQAQSMKISAQLEGVTIRWGGDWDSDTDTLDQSFNDLPHFEIVHG